MLCVALSAYPCISHSQCSLVSFLIFKYYISINRSQVFVYKWIKNENIPSYSLMISVSMSNLLSTSCSLIASPLFVAKSKSLIFLNTNCISTIPRSSGLSVFTFPSSFNLLMIWSLRYLLNAYIAVSPLYDFRFSSYSLRL